MFEVISIKGMPKRSTGVMPCLDDYSEKASITPIFKHFSAARSLRNEYASTIFETYVGFYFKSQLKLDGIDNFRGVKEQSYRLEQVELSNTLDVYK